MNIARHSQRSSGIIEGKFVECNPHPAGKACQAWLCISRNLATALVVIANPDTHGASKVKFATNSQNSKSGQ